MKTTVLPRQVLEFLEDAHRYGEEHSVYGRETYVHPAIIEVGEDTQRHTGFIRDVSVSGMGLLHFVELQPQRINVETRRFNDQIIRVSLDLAWCVGCGEGCYISGGTFVSSWTD